MRDGEIAAQKAALSKALSAAYLEHQVADLESRVNAIGVNGGGDEDVRVGGGGARMPPEGARGTHGAIGDGAIGDGAPRRSPMTSAPVSPRAPGGPLFKPANAPGLPAAAVGAPNRVAPAGSPPAVPLPAVPSPAVPPPAAADGVERASRSQRSAGTRDEVERVARIDDSDDDDGDDPDAWRVAVVDVSALMWAPHSVRSLLQRGGEVIVPLDAVRTLDMLKKGGSPAAVAARAAARFIEHASRHWRPISADPSIAVQGGTNYRRGQGLRLQRETEERSLDDTESDTPPPKWVASVLGCAAFFSVIARAEDEWDEHPAVLIAHPPLSAEVGPNPVDERRGPGAPPHAAGAGGPEAQTSYADRAEGYTLSLEAGRFELRLEVLRDEDADKEVPRQRRRNHHGNEHGQEQRGRGGRGRGRGRGGRAGGSNANTGSADAEPVRILLRRPDHDDAPAGAVGAAAPAPPHMPPPTHPTSMPAKSAAPAPSMPSATPSAAPVLLTPDAHRGRGGGGGGASGGGRGRGRGRGRGSERNTDRGGGFTLLQRPGPPLAHHVRDVGEAGAGAATGAAGASGGGSGGGPSGSGGGGGGGNKPRRDRNRENSRDRRGAGAGGSGSTGQWRRAYAANDESPRAPRQNQPKATPALERERERERDQPRVVLLQRPR